VKLTRILLRSPEPNEFGLPQRLAVYQLGEPRRVGSYFNVPVFTLRENELKVPPPPVLLQVTSAQEALDTAVRHYEEQAGKLGLSINVSDLPEQES